MSKREQAARILHASCLGWLLRQLTTWNGVLVINYHRIGRGSDSAFDRELWSATPEDFDAQVRFLKENYDIIGADDLDEVAVKRYGRYVQITFDDGYRDNYECAYSILRSHGVSATFFLTTGFIDQFRLPWWDEIAWMVRTSERSGVEGAPWLSTQVTFDEPDREQAIHTLLSTYKSLPGEATGVYLDFLAEATGSDRYDLTDAQEMWMTWDMVREMRQGGMWFGGHTVNHPVLANLPREQQAEEIAGCKKRIETELDEPMILFSYPVGGPQSFNDDTRASLKEHGVKFSYSYYGGFRRSSDWDPYDIRRIAMESYISPELFRATVTLPQLFT
jgi:peptidoglycan/xylan/chitin deacetylase (PgdA/CDA1 family)